MQSLLHLATGLDALLAACTTAWAALADLLTAASLLWLLNQLANAIRLTYVAGRWCGRLWYGYGHPAMLTVADAISWAFAQIDWHEVRVTIRAGFTVLLALAITVGVTAHRWLIAASAALGRWYAARLTTPHPIRPAAHHLAPAARPSRQALQAMSNRQLRELTGTRRKLSKAQLIALAIA